MQAAPEFSPNAEFPVTEEHKAMLRHVARQSIEHGLRLGRPLAVDPQEYAPPLTEPKGIFVTLRYDGQLRGCLGTLEAAQPLIAGDAQFAFAAAFSDPRFESVTNAEMPGLHIQISIPSEPEQIRFSSEQELIDLLRPGVDGLVLHYWSRHSTLLPSVWQEIPEPREFLTKLKQKAGLAPDFWSHTLEVSRYTTNCF
jgi:uncharacterized protein